MLQLKLCTPMGAFLSYKNCCNFFIIEWRHMKWGIIILVRPFATSWCWLLCKNLNKMFFKLEYENEQCLWSPGLIRSNCKFDCVHVSQHHITPHSFKQDIRPAKSFLTRTFLNLVDREMGFDVKYEEKNITLS